MVRQLCGIAAVAVQDLVVQALLLVPSHGLEAAGMHPAIGPTELPQGSNIVLLPSCTLIRQQLHWQLD